MNRTLPVILAALTLALAAGNASAQRIDSPYRWVENRQTLTVFGAWVDADPGIIGAGPQASPAFGVRYGIRIGGAFSGEADLFTVPTTRTVLDTATVAGTYRVVGESDATLLAALAALRFNITGPRTFHGVQPHVIFGGGAVLNLSGRSDLDDEVPEDVRFNFGTSFAGQLGVGAEWFATERISLRADARALLWKLRTPVAFRLGGRAEEIPGDEWKRNNFFGFGVGYHF